MEWDFHRKGLVKVEYIREALFSMAKESSLANSDSTVLVNTAMDSIALELLKNFPVNIHA